MNRRVTVLLTLLISSSALAQPFPTPLSPGGTYDPSIPTPASVVGFAPGEHPARYAQVVDYFKRLAAASPRVKMMQMGESTEHRPQYYLAISDPANIAELDRIKADHVRLSDPRTLTEQAAKTLAKTLPAVVWIGYGIHGDEISSVDAAVNVAYQLAAGTDTTTLLLLKNLVVCVDPMENPDGRERYLAYLEQWAGTIENTDVQSIHHGGIWPGGRGSHYMFDLNRDWFAMTHPETRERVQTVLQWHPQVFIDSHEMGAYDTYLFSPARQPLNPHLSPEGRAWLTVFSKDQAQAFDRFGWSYYTREWSDDWYPGYANSWAEYIDAVGILYEQAGVEGSMVVRPDGTTLRYRETVHHHVVSSLANCQTAARHREELLLQYAAARRDALRPIAGQPRAFVFLPGTNPARADQLVQRLLWQGIEVSRTDRDATFSGATSSMGGAPQDLRVPKGSYIVPLEQPASRLARAILEFDPRMTTAFLQEERKELEKNNDSKLYDVTAWSLPLASGVGAYALATDPGVSMVPVRTIEQTPGAVEGTREPYGYLIPYDDRGVGMLVGLFQNGVHVRSAKEKFAVDGHSYDRGTLLVRVKENTDSVRTVLERLSAPLGVRVYAVPTALSTDGPDLGGNDFTLLHAPRVAMVAGPGISSGGFGGLWQMMDQRLHLGCSFLQLAGLGSTDLRKYTVLVLPPSGDAQSMLGVLGKGGVAKLRAWVDAGGTLIGVGGASTFLADTAAGLSTVRMRSQALKELDLYARATDLALKAENPVIDSVALWSGRQVVDTMKSARTPANEKDLALTDARGKLFMPRGALLRVDLDKEHWLSFGAGDQLAAVMFTSSIFLAREPVRTPARFSGPTDLRLSGLLWPEARDLWARSAYATRESKGKGQIILFAGEPTFRGYFPGTERLLINAILLGPGWGTEQF